MHNTPSSANHNYDSYDLRIELPDPSPMVKAEKAGVLTAIFPANPDDTVSLPSENYLDLAHKHLALSLAQEPSVRGPALGAKKKKALLAGENAETVLSSDSVGDRIAGSAQAKARLFRDCCERSGSLCEYAKPVTSTGSASSSRCDRFKPRRRTKVRDFTGTIFVD